MNPSAHWVSRRSAALQREAARADRNGGLAYDETDEGYLYRPGQMLLGSAAVDVLRTETRTSQVRPDEATNARFEARGVDVQRWLIPSDIRLPELRRSLESRVRSVDSHAELNHVFAGEWVYRGGPASEPQVAVQLSLPQSAAVPEGTPQLAVLDTGVTDPAHAFFADSLLSEVVGNVDLLDEDGNTILDTEAGHGTFICGLAQRIAPGLRLEQRKVLNSNGFGDDLAVALGVAETTAAVLNLSLGGYTASNREPKALQSALAALDPSRVVVAAAGNNALGRPFWPAAFPHVIAVAAYDSTTGQAAPFSNFGPWVDVCAPGVNLHSCYVEGRRTLDASDPAFTGWAAWSGTSFAAPLVAAEIARRASLSPSRSAGEIAQDLLAELAPGPGTGYGRRFVPSVDLTMPAAAGAAADLRSVKPRQRAS